MWLVLDTGNSSTKAGLFDPKSSKGSTVLAVHRFEPGPVSMTELQDFVGKASIVRVGGVSVVPNQNGTWIETVRHLFGLKVEYFDENSRLPFEITYTTPKTMGNDRIAVAAGGWNLLGKKGKKGVIVVDAGTAINYEIVRPNGIYPGGVIAPGPVLIGQAMGLGTAQLPLVSLEAPVSRIGRSTDEAIRSGIMYGVIDSVRSMVEQIQVEEARRDPQASYEVVLTGGWGQWLAEQIGYRFEDHLVLKGVIDLMKISAE
ncbi:MAG: type III pantothenate kinase [Bacteroidetes bacterium]|nr:type III pantothenate kinase [Bacteroidota bacterium]